MELTPALKRQFNDWLLRLEWKQLEPLVLRHKAIAEKLTITITTSGGVN